MNKNEPNRRKGFSNMWQSLVLIATILMVGWMVNDKLDAAIFTEEEVTSIATTAAEAVIKDYKTDIALTDADDFMKGWINADGISIDEYIQNAYDFKTRVFKGGMLMIENEYETRDAMIKKYGDRVVNDLVEKLIRFND